MPLIPATRPSVDYFIRVASRCSGGLANNDFHAAARRPWRASTRARHFSHFVFHFLHLIIIMKCSAPDLPSDARRAGKSFACHAAAPSPPAAAGLSHILIWRVSTLSSSSAHPCLVSSPPHKSAISQMKTRTRAQRSRLPPSTRCLPRTMTLAPKATRVARFNCICCYSSLAW